MGANSTLLSYGIDVERLRLVHRTPQLLDDTIRASIPQRHKQFLRSLANHDRRRKVSCLRMPV